MYDKSDFTAGIPNMKARSKTMNQSKETHHNARLKALLKEAEALGQQKAEMFQQMQQVQMMAENTQRNLQALEMAAAQLLPSSLQQPPGQQQPPMPDMQQQMAMGGQQQEMPMEAAGGAISNAPPQEAMPPIAGMVQP